MRADARSGHGRFIRRVRGVGEVVLRSGVLIAAVANRFAERAGTTWRGLAGSSRAVFIEGKLTSVTADEAYLRESILNASAKIAAGFEKGEFAMPSYAGVLSDTQIDSLVLYIKSLK